MSSRTDLVSLSRRPALRRARIARPGLALVCAVLGVLTLATPALADDLEDIVGGLDAIGYATFEPTSPGPHAQIRPIARRIERNGVSVSIDDTHRTDTRGAIDVRWHNANPFGVVLDGVVLTFHTDDPNTPSVQLRPEQTVTLDKATPKGAPSSWRFVPHAAAPKLKPNTRLTLASARFWITPHKDALASLERLRGGFTVGAPHNDFPVFAYDQIPKVKGARFEFYEAMQNARHLALITQHELALRGTSPNPPNTLEADAEDAKNISARFTQIVCEIERQALHNASEPGNLTRSLHIIEHLSRLARFDASITACFRQDDFALVVVEAQEHGLSHIALSIAQDFDRGHHTPLPFRDVLVQDASDRLDRDLKGSNALGALQHLHRVQQLDPSAPVLARRVEVIDALNLRARSYAERFDFTETDYTSHAIGEELTQLQRWDDPRAATLAPLIRDRVEAAQSEIAYHRGRYQFHHLIHEPGVIPKAHASFESARAYAPTMSWVYRFGLVFIDHQFKSIFSIVALIAGAFAFSRSRTAWRLRLRRLLSRARRHAAAGQHHEARELFWQALSGALGQGQGRERDLALQAHAAGGVLEQAQALGDVHDAAEVSDYISDVPTRLRPEAWRRPEPLLAHMLTVPARDAATLDAHRRLLRAVFPQDRAFHAAADGLCAEARMRAFPAHASPGAKRDALHDAVAALALAADADLNIDTQRALMRRAGRLAATFGPALLDTPDAGWALTWEQLKAADCDTLDPELRAARAIAAAVAAPLPQAVSALSDLDRWADDPRSREAAAAALTAAARRAQLPVPSADAPTLEATRSALQALADLDNLITRHLSGVRALDARLRVAILRCIGGRATGLADHDTEYADDCRELLRKAEGYRDRPQTLALAAILDLLTPGDWGFDAHAAQATGEEGSLYTLLGALDAYTGGRTIEAASLLADIDAQTDTLPAPRSVRLLTARALVAGALGQHHAALQALQRADTRAQRGDASPTERALVDASAARLIGALLTEGDLNHPGLLAAACRGLLADDLLPAPPCPWADLGLRLATFDLAEGAALALKRSQTCEPNPAQRRTRAAAWNALARHALARRDYAQARRCAILARRDTRGGTTTTPTHTHAGV